MSGKTDRRSTLAELLRKADAEPDVDTLREGVRVMTQALMELEVAQHLGAERYQSTPDRQGERNGYRCARSSDVSLTRYTFMGSHFTGSHPLGNPAMTFH